jgi:glycerophosphoryl diester phosphodiesterase
MERPFNWVMDRVYASLPQPVPELKRLRSCKIISHRGERDNQHVFENTIAAFNRVADAGAWGLEFDVRWTKDLQPVISHDQDARRLYGSPLVINRTTLATLKAELPLIPTLEEVIARYGGKLHLMIELKQEDIPDPARQAQTLKDMLAPLRPGDDFHILSLHPRMFELTDFVAPSAFLAVSMMNTKRLSELTLRRDYAGIAGHYVFLKDALLARHQQRGQKVGTGFIYSKNCLFRELNRGVDWIFTNHAAKIQSIRNAYL